MSQPFSRSIAMMAAISAMLAANPGIPMSAMNLPVYTSRGKGRGGKMCRTNYGRGGPSGKYMPHQGKQEIARRLARMAKSA